jgi:Beta-1,3-glucanase
MKTRLGILILTLALTAGCGSSVGDFSSFSTSNGARSSSLIPPGGGEVSLPLGTGFSGSLVFDPGAEPQTRISLLAATSPPPGTSFPLIGLDSPHATTESFFFLSFSVSKPTPLSLLEGVRLQGGIPEAREHYHADFFEYNSSGTLSQGEGGANFLQEIPGEYIDSVATFDEVIDGAILQPDRTYLMRFKSTEQQILDLTIINDSGVSPCYVFITGRNPNLAANDNRFYWVNPQGHLAPMDVDDLENGFADYNTLLPSDGKLTLPLMSAGRVYVSLGEKMKTQLNPPQNENDPPAFWVAPSGWSNSQEPNYQTLFDWVEFDYKISPDSNLPGMGINKTEVQMVSLPFTISMTGPTTGTQTVGAKEGARSAVFQAIANEPDFADLIVTGTATGTNVSPIRVVSPDNGIYNKRNNVPNVPTFALDHYDAYIDAVWTKYKAEDLTMVTSAFGTYVGRVNAQDQMVFSQSDKRSVVVPKPSSADVIIGDGALIADVANATTDEERNVVREIASTMSACFNRSTLLVFPKLLRTYVAGSFDPALFYQDPTTNVYSKVIHANSLPTEKAPFGAAYGFGFDDNLDQSSFIGDNRAPTSVTITVTKF